MRTVLTFIILLNVLFVQAQRECASSAYISQQRLSKTAYQYLPEAVESHISKSLSLASRARTDAQAIIRIPVVVHVIYSNSYENISDVQINSQIEVLNQDFRRLNADAINTPDHFKPFAADAMIEFYLAKADPKGRATNGIVRKASTVTEWGMDDAIKSSMSGGSDTWDSKSYLNIWVAPLRKVLGYSSEPGGPADKDGIVISTKAFGTIGTTAPFHLGRTAVHEAGHWLGLKHIWGDAYCGNDLVHDTPSQSSFSSGCPTGIRSSCNSGPNGNMYMNFMDFTNDACMNLFTTGQKERMRALFTEGGPRYEITVSKGLNEPWNHSQEVEAIVIPISEVKASLFPNPAQDKTSLQLPDESWLGKELQVINMNGVVINTIRIVSQPQQIALDKLERGIYFLRGQGNGERIQFKLVKL